MVIKEGYKQTEIGVIPNDWEVKSLGDIAFVLGGGTPSTNINSYWNGDINWFTPTEIGSKKYSYESIRKLTKLGFENSSSKILPVGTILLTSRAGIGDISILMNEGCTNQGFQSLVAKKDVHNEFLYYLVSTLKSILLQNASGSTFLEISPNKVKSIEIVLPSLTEQTAIAKALSDADGLITGLEKLIAKKRNIKQGVIQQLLKPKEGWMNNEIGNVFQFRQGVQCAIEKQSTEDSIGLKRFIRIVDLSQTKEIPRYINDPGLSHHIKKTDLFMVRYGNPGLLGYGYDGVIANNLFRLIPKIRIESNFFYYLLYSKNEDILQLSSSTTMAALNFTSLKILKLDYPKSLSEQTRIAKILSDMDGELSALEQKLEKYKKVKLGMMQELLTGKTRLV